MTEVPPKNHARRCFIIAEAGVNHNGSLSLAKKLVDVAKKAGADAVKFQTFKAEKLVTAQAAMADYQAKNIGKKSSQLEMLKKLELGEDEFRELFEYCNSEVATQLPAHCSKGQLGKSGIRFMSTPFDIESADFLATLGMEIFKIPSGEITNFPLLAVVAKKGRPIMLSTGMSTMQDIRDAVNYIKSKGNSQITILHCVSDYPTRIEDINLRCISTLEKEFSLGVGLSDHTTSIVVPELATALGACVVEKHFTLDKKMEGPDHKASLEPDELEDMIRRIRRVETKGLKPEDVIRETPAMAAALGDGIKKITKNERETQKIARKSLVARIKIPKGTVIDESHVDAKRPGTGMSTKRMPELIGKRAKRGINKDEMFSTDMVG